MRGALNTKDEDSSENRIIPADAGSTILVEYSLALRRDHPRRCGEHGTRYSAVSGSTGSSPQMRGAPAEQDPAGYHRGIIPADAGSTKGEDPQAATDGDHPRRCGEHSAQGMVFAVGLGSSPQMRGAPPSSSSYTPTASGRIIPADAGSTAG